MVSLAGAPAWAGAAGIYLAIGGVVGLLLARAGQPSSTAIGALAAWPLLLGMLSSEREELGEGPMSTAIARAFAALDALIEQQRQQGFPVAWSGELGALRRAVEQADARLAVADGILADLRHGSDATGVAEDLAALARARDRAAAELRAVLGGVQRLRIQVGLLALSEIRDEAAVAVRQHLEELHARARAIEEISSLGPGLPRTPEPPPP